MFIKSFLEKLLIVKERSGGCRFVAGYEKVSGFIGDDIFLSLLVTKVLIGSGWFTE